MWELISLCNLSLRFVPLAGSMPDLDLCEQVGSEFPLLLAVEVCFSHGIQHSAMFV